jgi:hypothetical protein
MDRLRPAELPVTSTRWSGCRKLRQLFFAAPRSLGQQTLAVEQQAGAYPEQLRWRLGPVLFVSLNVPGSNNNFGNRETPSREYLARNPAVIEWLRAELRHGAGAKMPPGW